MRHSDDFRAAYVICFKFISKGVGLFNMGGGGGASEANFNTLGGGGWDCKMYILA